MIDRSNAADDLQAEATQGRVDCQREAAGLPDVNALADHPAKGSADPLTALFLNSLLGACGLLTGIEGIKLPTKGA